MPKKLLFLDTETTGLDEKDSDGFTLVAHELHSVIELAVIVDIDGKMVDKACFYACPRENDNVDIKALNINGRTEEEIKAFPPQIEMYKGLLQVLGKWVDPMDKEDKFQFVAFNSKFDENFIRQLFTDHNDKYYGSWFWNPTIDVLQLAAIVLMETGARYLMPNMKLATIARHLGIEPKEGSFHSALYDTRITRQIFYKLTS